MKTGNSKMKPASNLTAENRLIFEISAGSGANPATGAEQATGKEAVEEWKQVDAKTQWTADSKETFVNLAKSAFPGDERQQTEYAQRIFDSLANHLAPGRTMEELWKYLEGQNCCLVAIIKGFLNFFKTGKTGDEKINIDDFFNIGAFSAEYPEGKEYAQKREEEIAKTQTALASLLADIQAAHPNLPTPTI